MSARVERDFLRRSSSTTQTEPLMSRLTTALLLALLTACAGPESGSAPVQRVPVTLAPPALQAEKPVDLDGVHNVVAYTPEIVSGSVPEGEAGFRTLASMGVHTIVSVDGAPPDVELAHKYGLQYVHLPIGYDGLTPQRTLEVAKAVQSAGGLVYVHCHHGKHRSAGAAAAASVTLNKLTNEQAVARMKVSGTAAFYDGLYACANAARPAEAATLAALPAKFPERVQPRGLKKAMVAIDEANDELKAIEKAGWKVPADHPDLVPTAVVKRMAAGFRGLLNEDEVKAHPADFLQALEADAKRAGELEERLGAATLDTADLSARLKALQASCKDCHGKYRD